MERKQGDFRFKTHFPINGVGFKNETEGKVLIKEVRKKGSRIEDRGSSLRR